MYNLGDFQLLFIGSLDALKNGYALVVDVGIVDVHSCPRAPASNPLFLLEKPFKCRVFGDSRWTA